MTQHPVETALRSGSRAKNFAKRITETCRGLPDDVGQIPDRTRKAILNLAAMCRATRAVAAALAVEDVGAIENAVEFSELFCSMYYPVLEDGKRTVGFWSVKDSATLTPDDVHEWVRDRKMDKKNGKMVDVVVPFGNWWHDHRPDYELYGVAADRAAWREKVIETEGGRKCVNTMHGKPPVIIDPPPGYDDGIDAQAILDAILTRTITDPDAANAERKRKCFVVDAGAHLLALRDGGDFRCRKLFCFASTNGGQGSGKSLLHESLAALVPKDASCTVPTTYLAGDNLLPLYSSSVCILTEAPSSANERYTAEDVKAFADAGWKTAQEKYVAKRPVRDNSLKLLSSNHLAPLPIDSPVSRRVEFFVSAETTDGGAELRALLDDVQVRRGWSVEQLRSCIGWALLLRAQQYLSAGELRPCPVARRTIDAEHLLSPFDYDHFVVEHGNLIISYSAYRDARTDKGYTWSPDAYRYKVLFQMSKSTERWVDDAFYGEPPVPPTVPPTVPPPESVDRQVEQEDGDEGELPETDTELPDESGRSSSETEEPAGPIRLQYKARMRTARIEAEQSTIPALYAYIVGDAGLAEATAKVRRGEADKRDVLRQIFPGAKFDRFTRNTNLKSFTGLTHVDFDHVSEKSGGRLTAAQVRDGLADLPGFVIGGVSSRGDGAWAIFHAGSGITDMQAYMSAQRSLFSIVEELFSMPSDHALRLPTAGRTLAHDPECRIADEAVCGALPAPYEWKAPTYKVGPSRLTAHVEQTEQSPDQQLRNERFLDAVVEKACANIQTAANGERHDTAIRAIANIVLCCRDRSMSPLASWGRRLRDACTSVGLDIGEVNSIMSYWKQMTRHTA